MRDGSVHSIAGNDEVKRSFTALSPRVYVIDTSFAHGSWFVQKTAERLCGNVWNTNYEYLGFKYHITKQGEGRWEVWADNFVNIPDSVLEEALTKWRMYYDQHGAIAIVPILKKPPPGCVVF